MSKPQTNKTEKSEGNSSSKSKGSIHNNYVMGALSDCWLAAEFLSEYVPSFLSSALDWTKIDSEKTSFFSEEARELVLDALFSAPYLGSAERQRFFFVFEHKSKMDRRAAFQILKYCMNVSDYLYAKGERFADGRSPWPLPILLYHGPKAWKNLPDISSAVGAWRDSPCAEEFERLFVPHFNYCAIDLAAMSVEELRGGPMLQTFLEVLKRATDGTLVDSIYDRSLMLIAKENDWSRYSSERIEKFLQTTIGYIDRTSQNWGKYIHAKDYKKVVEAVGNERVKHTMSSFIEEFREEGYKLGHNAGRYETIFKSIQMFLNDRFGEIPQSLQDKIDAIDDYPTLEDIQRFAWRAKSLDDVERFVDRVGVSK